MSFLLSKSERTNFDVKIFLGSLAGDLSAGTLQQ